MEGASGDVHEAVEWASDDYSRAIHDELMTRVSDLSSHAECNAPSPRESFSNESVSSTTTDSSIESNVESPAQRIARLKQPSFTDARMNDGYTFLMMESCANTSLGRALRGNLEIKCSTTLTLEDVNGIEVKDGWHVNVLCTPHKAMSTSDLNHVKSELESSFGADAGMDACPRLSYTFALSKPCSDEYASFVSFRPFAVVNHKRKCRMLFVYIDHIVTNKKHRRKHLGQYMIELIKRACVPMCQMYRIPMMHVVAQASFEALPFWTKFMHPCTDASLVMLRLVQNSDSQDDSAPNRRTGRLKIKLFADVIDMLMEVPVS